MSRPLNFFSSLKVNTTSAAVNGLPSDHFTPLRMVNVTVLLSLLHTQEVASHGEVLPLSRLSMNTSGS
jgi:hypothetical protein